MFVQRSRTWQLSQVQRQQYIAYPQLTTTALKARHAIRRVLMYRFEVWSRPLQSAVCFPPVHLVKTFFSLTQTYVATASVDTRTWASEVLVDL